MVRDFESQCALTDESGQDLRSVCAIVVADAVFEDNVMMLQIGSLIAPAK